MSSSQDGQTGPPLVARTLPTHRVLYASLRKIGLIQQKSRMSDADLARFFENEKRENNTKHNVQRAIRKFREYCKNSKSLNF